MEKIKICLVGAGRAGEVHGDVYNEFVKNAEIASVIDINPDQRNKLASKYNLSANFAFETLREAIKLTKFDAVVITTPTFTHCDYVLEAANNKMHVFCEKPMATSLEDCDKMIDACAKAKVILQIGFMRRFDPGFILAKNIIKEGTIGMPLIIKSLTHGPGLPGAWALDIKNSNGMLAEVNSHDFDTIRWLSNSDFNSVYAVANNFNCSDIKEKYPNFYDTSTVSLELNNQSFGLVDGICPCFYGYDARAEVIGSKGVIFIGSLQESTTVTCTKDSHIVVNQIKSWKKRFHEAYVAEDRHFVDCILNNKQPVVTGLDGKKAVEIVIAANKSISEGKKINL